MNTATPHPGSLQDTRNILGFAAILSAGFTAIGLVGVLLQVVNYTLIPAGLCGVAGVIMSWVGVFLAPRVRNLTALNGVILVGFVLTATLAIHFAGGPQSFLPALYMGITVAAAFLIGRRGALRIAALACVCFGGLIGLEFFGLVPIFPMWDEALDLSGHGAVLGGLLFSMAVPTFVVAYVSGTLAERLAWRTAEQAALAVIARDLASSLNPDQVIQTVLKRAIENTPSDRGGIHLYETDRQRVRVVAMEGSGFEPWNPADSPIWPATIGIVGRVLRSSETARIGDVSLDPDYFAAALDSRSELCVPVVQDGRVEGAINLESNRLDAYTDAHQRFVEQLAQHAAIALNNAQLYAHTERNLHDVARANLEIRALQESLFAIQSTLELDQALQRICDAVVTLGYDLATLAIADRAGRRLDTRAVAAIDVGLIGALESLLGFPLIGMGAKLRQAGWARNIGAQALAEKRVLVSNHAADFLYPAASRDIRSQAVERIGLRIGAAIPLIARDAPLGVLYAFSRKPDLTASDLASLQAFGAQAAVVLDKANLFEEARTVRDRLQAVLDATHDGLIFFDMQTRMALTNRAAERLLGVSLTPHLGKPMAVVLDHSGLLDRLYPNLNPAERQAVIDTEVNVMNAGLRDGTGEVARRLITATGGPGTLYVEEFSLRVEDEQRRLIGRLIVLHDVTDHKQLEADRDAFTQMLVHDLRSPLSAVIGSLQLVEIGLLESDPVDLMQKSVQVALASSNKLLSLIGSLLDVRKLETGQLELQMQPLAPASLIENALETLRPLAGLSNIALEAGADADLPAVYGDAEHIGRVLTNLVDNALKFVGEGGRVRVAAARDGRFVQFSVADNGPGIPAEYHGRIFDRYVQVPGRAGRRRGTGLGLTYCKLVIEMHGGEIWVESPLEGGSNFLFTLPITRRV